MKRKPFRKFLAAACLAGVLLAIALSGCSKGGDEGPPPGEVPPIAVLSLSPAAGPAPLNVGYDGTSSADPDGGDLSYFWEFGNGVTSTSPWGVVTYENAGTFTIRLTVTDPTDLAGISETVLVVGTPSTEDTFAHQVLYLTNLERRAQGLPPLKGEDSLARASFGHLLDMAMQNYFAHESLDGRSPWDRIEAEGYIFDVAGENIAAGYPTPRLVVDAWMASPGHRENILYTGFRELGVAYYFEQDDTYPGPTGYYHYWGQDFGLRNDVYPVVINDEAFQTSSRTVDLYIYGQGWAVQMKISESPAYSGASWQPYTSSTTFQLSPGAGLKTVHVRLRNNIDTFKDTYDQIVLQ